MADETLPPKCVSCFLAWGEHDVCTCGPLKGKPTPLESLAEENERLRKALAEVHQRYVDANEARIDAEAQLAGARKALGLMLREHDILSGNFGDVVDPKHRSPDRWPTAAEAARRALEGGE